MLVENGQMIIIAEIKKNVEKKEWLDIMKKLTTEEFIIKSNLIHNNKYNYSKTIYSNCKLNVVIICPIHGEFLQTPEHHLKKRGCLECGILNSKETNIRKYGVENVFSNESIKDKIKKTMIDKYGGIGTSSNFIKSKIENTCLAKYGHKNIFSEKNIIKKIVKNKNYKKISEKCKKTNIKKYGVDCVLKLNNVRKDNLLSAKKSIISKIFNGDRLEGKVTPLFTPEDYINVNTQYKFSCNLCNTIFFDNLDDGKIPKCTYCFPYIPSKGEHEILEYIKTIYNGTILTKDRKIMNGLELDIYVPEKNLAIEFNGLYYHSEIAGGKNKKYHLNKTILCKQKNIQLIHIFEDEWLMSKEIIKSKLKNLLHTSTLNKIYARKCYIQEVSATESNVFLNENHLQKKDKSLIRLGLFHNKVLVALMTFGKLRNSLGNNHIENHYEMYRFCVQKNYSVIGGASKLLNLFIKKYNPLNIISYADIRWSVGNLYEKIGFKKINDTSPNYWYLIKNKRYHRYGFRKNILHKKLLSFDPTKTEWENMKNNGYDRIWDCGNLKYEWTSK